MSFIADFLGFGGGEEAAVNAAQIQAKAAREAAVLGAAGSEAGIEELRRQFEATEARLAPFVDVGQRALRPLEKQRTFAGFADRLSNIQDTDIFGDIVDERTRAIRGQLAAGGLTRSGTALKEIAGIPTDVALAIEDLIARRTTNVAAGGQSAAAGLGGIGVQTSSGIANFLEQQAGAQALGVQQAGQAASGGILAGQRAGAQASQNILNTAATVATIFFSDPRLKENVEEIGQICNLKLYQWDWIPQAKGTIIEKCMDIGFMANEVLNKYPQHIEDFGGFMTINYPALLNELERRAV